MPASKVEFKTGTRAQYLALQTKPDNVIYFLTDSGEIYKGSVLMSGREHFKGVMTGSTDEVWLTSGYKAGDFSYAQSECAKSIGGTSITIPTGGVLLCVSDFNSSASASDFVVLAHGSGSGDVTASGTLTLDTIILGAGNKVVKSLANPNAVNKILAFTGKGIEWVEPLSSPTPNALVITLNGGNTEGTDKFTFNGSLAKSVNIDTCPVWGTI